jgi:cyclin-C
VSGHVVSEFLSVFISLLISLNKVIQSLGEQLKMRQQVIASATVYFRRFYAKYSLKCIDPFLLAPTCLFLATKVEEFGLHSQQRFATTTATLSNFIGNLQLFLN